MRLAGQNRRQCVLSALLSLSCPAAGDKKYFKKYTLFSRCEYEHDGLIKFKLNPDMTTFLLQLRGDFCQPLLDDFLRMRSPYSMAIWHLMQREMHSKKPGLTNIIEFELSIEELREITGTQEKLKQLGQFKERVFDKALREIEDNCGVKITYENIKRGRTVVAFRCRAVSLIHISEDRIPQSVKDKARLGVLRITSAKRELTEAEQKEYNSLINKTDHVELKF